MANPILEGVEGITLTSTGLVVVKEHFDFVENVFANRTSDQLRSFRLVMTLNHEATHFLQCFTASFPYTFSMAFFRFSSDLMTLSRSNQLTPKIVHQYRNVFRSHVKQYKSPYRDLTTIDLLEAMAVTEGYRGTIKNSRNNPEEFNIFLHEWFPDPKSEYRKAIDIITSTFGQKAGFDLTPRLCYIALNGDNPAKNFWTMVDTLASDYCENASNLSACKILKGFGMDIHSSLLAEIENGLPKENQHPMFKPFMNNLTTIGSLSERYEFAARPGQFLRASGPAAVRNLIPPLVICSGGQGRIMGIADTWSKKELFNYIYLSGMIGACLGLLSKRQYPQTCAHEECPVYQSALCHSWYAKPHNKGWAECVFPDTIQKLFGRNFQEVIELFE